MQTFDTLDQMQSTISARRQSSELIDLAVLGVTNREIEPQALSRRLAEIEALGCKCVVLCPTTEQASYHDSLPEAHSYTQLQGKPACTRKLQRVLVELVRPNQAYAEPAAAAPSRAAQVLCVDDNPANLLLVKTLLGDMGADVVAVDNGPAALEAVKQHSFDLVLMDVQMPGMDGRQTTEAIRQWEQASSSAPLPIVALTAHALANEKRSLLQSGLDDYLTKPISDRQLAQVVLKWTGLALRSQPQRIAEASPTAEQSLKVLDQEEGLRLAAGKADLADDMLGMLLQSLEGDRRTIREARLAGDRQALIERVHRLHGATRYCGVPQLRNACQQSETLLKQNHPDSEAALDELDAAIGRLEQEIHANG